MHAPSPAQPVGQARHQISRIDHRSTIDHDNNVHPNPQRHAIGVAALELYSQFQVAALLRNASGYYNTAAICFN